MSLEHSERFSLKRRLIATLDDPDAGWGFEQQNLLLAEFELPTLYSGMGGPSFGELIANIPDSELLAMARIVLGEGAASTAATESVDGSSWNEGYLRLFISHSAKHRELVGEVSRELAVAGIQGFVAHDTMTYDRPWQAQIEQALRSAQAFLAIVHPEYNDSPWCLQEAGWALGRGIPVYAIRMGAVPAGFLGKTQWPSENGSTARQIAGVAMRWLRELPEFGSALVDGLLVALREASNYYDAGAAAKRLVTLEELKPEQWARLDKVYWENDQINHGILASRELRPFYALNKREFPPRQPE